MTPEEAQHIIEKQVMAHRENCALIPDSIKEHSTCFSFYYQSKSYLTSGNTGEMLVGHGPIIVDKKTGKFFETGSVYSEGRYVMAHEACGNPLADPTNNIIVQGWLSGAEKVNATKFVKQVSTLSLSGAKKVIDNALENQSTTFEVAPAYDASEVSRKLNSFGFRYKQLWSTK